MTILYASPDRAALPASEVRARTPSAPSGDYSAFVKRTVCDANSRFSFSGLANGAWYVITVAKPVAPGTGPDVAVMRRVEALHERDGEEGGGDDVDQAVEACGSRSALFGFVSL